MEKDANGDVAPQPAETRDNSTDQTKTCTVFTKPCPLVALCRYPPPNIDEIDTLGVILKTQLTKVQSDLILFRKALKSSPTSSPNVSQAINTKLGSLPNCAQFLISEYCKQETETSFASPRRPDLVISDCKFVLAVGDNLSEILVDCYAYTSSSLNGHRKYKQIVIAKLSSSLDKAAFLHTIITPLSSVGTKTYLGTEWNAYRYGVWLCPDLNNRYRILRLHKRSKETPEDSGSSTQKAKGDVKQEGMGLADVIASIEDDSVNSERFSKRKTTQVNYNIPDMYNNAFGTDPKPKRQRKSQVCARDKIRTQQRDSISMASTDISLSRWVSARNSETAPDTSHLAPSVKDSVEDEATSHGSMDIDKELSDNAATNTSDNGDETRTSVPDTSMLSDSTLVDPDIGRSRSSTHGDSVLRNTGVTSPGVQPDNLSSVETVTQGRSARDRTVVHFINITKGINKAVPLSICSTHDDVHDCAVIYKIATPETRLLRVEFEASDDYEVLASDMPEHFDVRFTQRIQTLHSAHVYDLAKTFTVKIFNSDRIRK